MKSFKAYLVEEKRLDKKFLKRATSVKNFDLRASDFQTLKYKKEIQHLYATYWFRGDPEGIPAFDLSKTQKGFNMDALNKQIGWLKKNNRKYFNMLYSQTPKGVGPGELLFYFLIDDAVVGGGASAGADVILVGGKEYELKASQVSGDGKSVYHFKLGGTQDLSKIQAQAKKLFDDAKKRGIKGLETKGKGELELGPGKINILRKEYPKEWSKIEKDYAIVASKYFGKQNIVFLKNNNETVADVEGNKRKMPVGTIAAVKMGGVKASDISIDSFTSGTVKPRVNI